MMAMLADSLIGTLFMLALLSGVVVWGIRETVQNSQMKIQVREQEIRIEQKNGEILRSISLSDVAGVSADINGDVYVYMLTSETGTCQTLVGIEKPDSFAVFAQNRIRQMKENEGHPKPAAEKPPEPVCIPEPVIPESVINEFRAAEHLVQQGKISPEQFAGMYSQPEPQQAPRLSQDEIDERNAAAYMQRREMLAQQLGGSFRQDEEKSNGK